MAITASGLYVANFVDILDATQLAVDLSLTTNKVAMFTNSLTAPNFTTDTAYGVAPYDANEVTGTGYTAGGTTVTSPTTTASSGSLVFDLADTAWSSSTLANARGALFYSDALAGNNAICLIDFGSDYSTTSGTFTIQWAAGGMFTVDLTP